jgi:hypothetical protein
MLNPASPYTTSKASYVLMNLEVGFPLPISMLEDVEDLPGALPKDMEDLGRIIEAEDGFTPD